MGEDNKKSPVLIGGNLKSEQGLNTIFIITDRYYLVNINAHENT